MEPGQRMSLGDGTFGRAYPRDDRLYVGRSLGSDGYWIAEYDLDWNPTGTDINISPSELMEGDHALQVDDNHVYHVAALQGDDTILGQLRKHDAQLDLVSQADLERTSDDEFIMDQSVAVYQGQIFVGTEHREDAASWEVNIPPDEQVRRGLHLRVFDDQLELQREFDLEAEIEAAWVPHQYWGMGTSQLWAHQTYHLFTQAPIGDTSSFDQGESAGARQIFALLFDEDFGFVEALGPLSDSSYDNYWCTGSQYAGQRFFVSHTFRRPEDGPVQGPPTPDQGHIALSMYDEDFQLLQRLEITNISSDDIGAGLGAHRSSLVVADDVVYVSFDMQGQVWLQEVLLLE